jgi:threonine dehydrogenase-like Zn-dependent dehydrogenase
VRAVQFKERTISFVVKHRPRISSGEVLIKPLMAGICHTDVGLYLGYHRFEGVPGHEFVGQVEEAPENQELLGKRVVSEINCGCGECPWCKVGNPRHCRSRKVIGIREWDGAFAEYVKAPLANIHPVDESISDSEAVFTEPLAAALQISRQIRITNATRTAVLGDGKLGLLIALALRHFNPDLLLIGKHPDKLSIARNQGVKTILWKAIDSSVDTSAELGLFDLVIEATGKEEGINFALNLVRPEGVIVVKTTAPDPSSIQLSRVVVDEIRIIGSRCGDFGMALSFLENKWVDVMPLIDATYSFDNFLQAFDHARRPGAKKVLVRY